MKEYGMKACSQWFCNWYDGCVERNCEACDCGEKYCEECWYFDSFSKACELVDYSLMKPLDEGFRDFEKEIQGLALPF
ncbi:MAG: hypothetical protein IJ642_03265 [Oscillospiraceae bacterium]|nr:hypothetical protein [Oscillospiraceae bacterium]